MSACTCTGYGYVYLYIRSHYRLRTGYVKWVGAGVPNNKIPNKHNPNPNGL